MKGFNISSKKKLSSFIEKGNINNNNLHRYYKNNNKSFGWKNTKRSGSKFDGTYRNDDKNAVERSYEDIYDYIINISYILNEKYEKYLIYEMREENINKGNKVFHHINLDNTCYYIEDDICILLKVIEEIKNNEIKIFDHRKGSKIIEKLIYYCFFLLKYNEKNVKNEKISMQCIEAYNNLLKVVSRYFLKLTLSNYGSHVIQSIICLFPYFNKYEYIYIEKLTIQNVGYKKMYDYFKHISDFVCDHLFEIIFDRCGTHVLRSFLYSLGGYLYINISNITFRKSKINKNRIKNKLNNNTNNELKYIDKNFQSNIFYEYIHKIVERISNEIEKPNISLKYKNLLYQYVYYDNNKKNNNNQNNNNQNNNNQNNNNKKNNNNISNNNNSNSNNNIMDQNNTKNFIPNIDNNHNNMNNSDNLKYIAESNNQHFICPLLYNTYSVPALVILFELLNDKNVECSSLIRQIFLINKTKLYYIEKTKEKDDHDDDDDDDNNNIVSSHAESPLKQLLDILIVLDNSSIMIEKLLKIKNEETFYIFNMYILKNVNKLICENIYSNMVLCNYFTNEYISEEMFDLLIKNIHIEQLMKNKTFNILKCLFFLAQWYKRNCRYLFNELIKNFHLNDEHKNGSNKKFMWICILCMCNYDDLPSLVRDIYMNKADDNCTNINSKKDNEKEQNERLYNKNNLGKNINNYNFYNYLKIDLNGYYILSYLLSFPKESITNLTNSFKYFCNFIKTVNINEPSSSDVENYQSFMENFSRKTEEVVNPVDAFIKDEEGMYVSKNVLHNNDNIKTKMNNNKPFYRKNIELRGNILLYFSCDKNLSILCEKIVHTFNLVNEKYLRRFITLFQKQYNNIAKHYIGAHTIVTFFKLGDDNIKKNILDSLIQNDINVYNNYIKNFMKLKEYQKSKTLTTNNKKYLKAKKLFQDLLMSKENGNNQNDINHKKEYDDKTFIEFERIHKISKHHDSDLNSNDKDTTVLIYDEQSNDNDDNNNNNILKEETNDDQGNKEHDPTYDNVTKSYKSSSNEKEEIVDQDNGFMNIITDYIKNTKTKSRKRKKEKDQIDNVLKRK
ncbi:conserved Plasmodium protein, unknown function [Plasmodium reichenowi]|uniref:Uncharacterized protein n=1 Tax=Plasmodium reichenowi TaxID=5854 RepID=A0A060S408_PLARE|nr:conserved Plasmodium protein, unknown function [Plasmodium reichenowi]